MRYVSNAFFFFIWRQMPSVPRINAYVIMFEWHSPDQAARQICTHIESNIALI